MKKKNENLTYNVQYMTTCTACTVHVRVLYSTVSCYVMSPQTKSILKNRKMFSVLWFS